MMKASGVSNQLQLFSATGELILTERKMDLSKLSPSQIHSIEKQPIPKEPKVIQDSESLRVHQISRAERPQLRRRAGSPLYRDRMPIHAKEKLSDIMKTWKEVKVKNDGKSRGDIRLRSAKDGPLTADADLMRIQSYQKEDEQWNTNTADDKSDDEGARSPIDDESTSRSPKVTEDAVAAKFRTATAVSDVKFTQAIPISPRDKLTVIRRSIAPLNPGFAPLVSTTSHATSSLHALGSATTGSQFEASSVSVHIPRRISHSVIKELTSARTGGNAHTTDNAAIKSVKIRSRSQSAVNSPSITRPTTPKSLHESGNLHLYHVKSPAENSAQAVGQETRPNEPLYSPATYRRPRRNSNEAQKEYSGNVLHVHTEDDRVKRNMTEEASLLLSTMLERSRISPDKPRGSTSGNKTLGTIYHTNPLTEAALAKRGYAVSKYIVKKTTTTTSPGKYERRRTGRDVAEEARVRGEEAKSLFDPLRFASGQSDPLFVESAPLTPKSNPSRKHSSLSAIGDEIAAELAREWSHSAPAPEQFKGLDSPVGLRTQDSDLKVYCCECTTSAALWCDKCRLAFCFECWGKVGHHNQTDAIHAMRAMKTMYKSPKTPWGFASDMFDYGEPEKLPIPNNHGVTDGTPVQPRVEPDRTRYDDYPLGEYFMDADGRLKPLPGGSAALSPLKSNFAPATGSALKMRLRESVTMAPRIRSLSAKGEPRGRDDVDAVDVESVPSTVKGSKKPKGGSPGKVSVPGVPLEVRTEKKKLLPSSITGTLTGTSTFTSHSHIQRSTSPYSGMTDTSTEDVAAMKRAVSMGSRLVDSDADPGDVTETGASGSVAANSAPFKDTFSSAAASESRPVQEGDLMNDSEIVLSASLSASLEGGGGNGGQPVPGTVQIHSEASGDQIVEGYIAAVIQNSERFKVEEEERKATAIAQSNIDTDFKARMHAQALKRMHSYEFAGPRVQQPRPHSPPPALNLGPSPVSIGGIAGSRKLPKTAVPLHMHTNQVPSSSSASRRGNGNGDRSPKADTSTNVSDMYYNIEKSLGLKHDTAGGGDNPIGGLGGLGGRESAVFNGKIVYIRNSKSSQG